MPRLTVQNAKHLGGHPQIKTGQVVRLSLNSHGVSIVGFPFKRFPTIPWDAVTGLDLEGYEAVQGRLTATRLVTFGIAGAGLRKGSQPGTAVITLHTTHGSAQFSIRGQAPSELGPRLAAVKAAYLPQNARSAPSRTG